MRGLFRGGGRGSSGHGRELGAYRTELQELALRIDARLADVAEDVDALRRRALDPDQAVERLTLHENALDAESDALIDMLAPEELHGLHMEYEANLERALRGIVTVERGCGLTRMRHRPPDDEEPMIYYKRGHANVTHARMRMADIADVLLTWEPGMPTDASVTSRLERRKQG